MPELEFQLGKKFKILAVLICWALVVFLFLFAMTNKFSRIKTTDSTRIQEQKNWEKPETTSPISCDRTHYDYEICYLNRPTTLDPTTATFFTEEPINSTHRSIEKIRPYPRNFLHTPFDHVRELTLTTAPSKASCGVTHNSPALVFSAGAWPGNFYHDFNENFIPLFITVDRFFPDRDFVIGIFNCSEWWLRHYMDLLSGYTRHPIINLDDEKAVHCFPSATVGLISHGASTVDPTLQRSPRPKTLHDFRAFIAATYSKSHASHAPWGNKTSVDVQPPALPPPLLPWRLEGRPRLVLLNRKGARTILNIEKVYQAALEVGFDVVVHEPSRETLLHEDFRLIDSSHALIAVHGAGLTNMLFLRKGSVLMQLAPKESEWLSSLFYGKMAIRLGLEYMVYDLGGDESLLGMDKATKERLARRGGSLENWVWYKDLKIKLDVHRFKKYLKRAYKKAKIFMQKESLKGNYYSKMGRQLKRLGRKFKIGYK